MARLFTCGFEENDLVNASTMWTIVSAVGASLVTSPVHSGTYALRVNPTGASCTVRRDIQGTLGEGNTLYTRLHFYAASIPGATADIHSVAASTGTVSWKLQLLSTGKLRVLNVAGGSTTFDSTMTLSVTTWYRIEMRHLLSDTVGQIEVRIYLADSPTALDTWGDGNFAGGDGTDADTMGGDVQRIFWGQTATTQTVDFYYDDLAVNNDTDPGDGSQMSWCGLGKIALMVPGSDVAVTWTKAGSAPAATNWDGVNDLPGAPPDDAVTYNEDSGNTNADRLGLTALPVEVPSNATMVLADASARYSAGAGGQSGNLRMWDDGGTPVTGPGITLVSGVWTMTNTNAHLVKNCAGKTTANLNAFNIGYVGLGGTGAKRFGTVWVNVEWTAGAGPAPTLMGAILL